MTVRDLRYEAFARALGLSLSSAPSSATMRPAKPGEPERPAPADLEAYARLWGGPDRRGGTGEDAPPPE